MTAPAPVFTCDRCGTTAPGDPSRRSGIPHGWEPYRPADYSGPVWCGACVGWLIADLLAAMRGATAGGR